MQVMSRPASGAEQRFDFGVEEGHPRRADPQRVGRQVQSPLDNPGRHLRLPVPPVGDPGKVDRTDHIEGGVAPEVLVPADLQQLLTQIPGPHRLRFRPLVQAGCDPGHRVHRNEVGDVDPASGRGEGEQVDLATDLRGRVHQPSRPAPQNHRVQ
jgi:hypothetical protein